MQNIFHKQFKCISAAFVSGVLMLCTLSGCQEKQVVLDQLDSADIIGTDEMLNFSQPQQDEEIAVITVKDYGDIKIKLFPEESPKGVENFKTLIEQGYYDELIFHRIIDSFAVQGGDPKGNGEGGNDCWNSGGFAQTISPNLHHFVGAVAYATGEDKLNGSQFYIVTGQEITEEYFTLLKDQYGMRFDPAVMQMYYRMGGQPTLDSDYEVFGQVIGGMENALAMQKVETDAKTGKPKKSVVIEKAEIVKYDGSGTEYLSFDGTPAQIS